MKNYPEVAIVTCMDYRIPKKVLGFWKADEIRVAGNIVTGIVLASLEISVVKHNVRRIIVLGHTDCGAIKEAVEAYYTGVIPEGHAGEILKEIIPLVKKVIEKGITGENLIEAVADENIKESARRIRKEFQKLVKKFEAAGDFGFAVIPAKYDLINKKVIYL